MDFHTSLLETIQESFEQYSGAVIQSRALVDVRDCVKPSTRQITYCLYTDGFTFDKPYRKTLKAIGSLYRLYLHGDASAVGILMRSAQKFSMRYPLTEVEGSSGTQMASESWSAQRYTSTKLSKISNLLMDNCNHSVINEWVDNYDGTEQCPRVLPSMGFYNIVNGSFGISTGIASSIPQFNLKEVNNALITLLENPDCSFDDILCYPDFCTGGTIINKDEIVDSLKNGQGKACIVRATVDYDKADNCLIVKDLPYGVYSNTICTEIEKLVAEDEDCGISNVNDLTGENVNIKIYLRRKNIQDKVLAILYDKTSLQKSISINMTMLEDGRFPKVFGWREALQAHLDHEKKIYINYYNYELEKLQKRLSIVQGLLIAINNIDSVVHIIKSSDIPKDELKAKFGLNDDQVDAILNMRLVRLSHLDQDKYEKEEKELEDKINDVKEILGSEENLKQVMINRFKYVANKFGDERRTKLTNVESSKNATKKKEKQIYDVYIEPVYMNGRVARIKKSTTQTENSFVCKSNDLINIVDCYGDMFRISAEDIKDDTGRGMVVTSFGLGGDTVCLVLPNRADNIKPYIVFGYNNGRVLKMDKSNLIGTTRNMRGKHLVKDGDLLVGVVESNGDVIRLKTSLGYCLDFDATALKASKSGRGRIGIKLREGDEVVSIEHNPSNPNVRNLGGKGYTI